MFSDEEISVFMDELEEKIEILNDKLLELEREGGSEAALQEIFRAAHTVKGSSGVMGYEKLADLTHEMENLFDEMRQGKLGVSEPLMDVLFEALDTVKLLRDELTGEDVGETQIGPVVEKLRHFRGGGAPPVKKVEPEEKAVAEEAQPELDLSPVLEDVDEAVIRDAEQKGYKAYWFKIEIDENCQMKSVRAFLIFDTLQQNGEIIKSLPDAQAIEEGSFDRGFMVLILTMQDEEHIKNLLLNVAEVLAVDTAAISFAKNNEGRQKAGKERQGEQEEGQDKAEHGERKGSQTVRVDVQKLDALMNLVGELVIDRTRLNRFADLFEQHFGSDDMVETLNEISNHLGQVSGDLQEQIMKARMLPVARVFNRFPRVVRDISHKLGKEIDFIVEGHETELDRNVIEVIGDPLIHLIRNSVDHGIETAEERVRKGKSRKGTLRLKAEYQESQILITVEDDGRGINPGDLRKKAIDKGLMDEETAARMGDREALNLIFMPGFSTAKQVSDLSGRGVGLDVVRTQIEQINGLVEFNSVPGKGTKFSIKLPLTLAIIRALMVSLGGQTYSLPLNNVVETIAITQKDIKMIGFSEVITVRGSILPLIRLSNIFRTKPPEDERLFVVVLGLGEKRVGVVVDQLYGEQEIVIKSLGEYLGQVPYLSGAAILGDGTMALIVDIRGLVKELGSEDVAYAEN